MNPAFERVPSFSAPTTGGSIIAPGRIPLYVPFEASAPGHAAGPIMPTHENLPSFAAPIPSGFETIAARSAPLSPIK